MRFSPFRFSLCIFPEIFFIFVQFSENDPKRLTPQAHACYTTSTLQHFSPIRREFYEISIIIPADFSRHFHDTVNHCRASFRSCCHPDRFCRPYFHCTDAVSGVPVCRSGVLSWCRCLKRQTAHLSRARMQKSHRSTATVLSPRSTPEAAASQQRRTEVNRPAESRSPARRLR